MMRKKCTTAAPRPGGPAYPTGCVAMCLSAEAFHARQRGEEVVTRFERLWPELVRQRRGLEALDAAARRSLDYLYEPQLQSLREYGKQMQLHAMRVALDCKAEGEGARQWYAATLPDEMAHMLSPAEPIPVSTVVSPRRAESAGRPAVHGASRRSSARSGDSGEDGSDCSEPPRGGRRCACSCGADISHRVRQARYLNDQHADADRQRRKRERDLLDGVPNSAKACQCAPQGNLVELVEDSKGGHCFSCGRAGGFETAKWLYDPHRQAARSSSVARRIASGGRVTASAPRSVSPRLGEGASR